MAADCSAIVVDAPVQQGCEIPHVLEIEGCVVAQNERDLVERMLNGAGRSSVVFWS